MIRTFAVSFVKSGINIQDYRDELITAIKHARLNLESRFGIDFQYMEFSEAGSVSVVFKDSHNLLNAHRLRGISAYLLKKYPEKFKPLRIGTRLFYYTEITSSISKRTSVVIPNESLPKKCLECFAYDRSGSYRGCNLYSLGIPARYLLGDLDSRPEWCELEEKEEE